jgi:2-keto-4-pentenoate hydratase
MSTMIKDPRVVAGMRGQSELRAQRIQDGDQVIGWKVGFGTAAAMANFAIDAPLVGFLCASGKVDSGSSYPLAGFTKAALEPEIAVHLGSDLSGQASLDDASQAISGLGPAFEIADLNVPLDDLVGVVSSNIFQRGYVLGSASSAYAGGSMEGLKATIWRDGEEVATTTDPLPMIGASLPELTRHVAWLLSAHGAELRAGQVIITGSVVPLLFPEPGASFCYELAPIGSLEVAFS